jgi:hypothetical protein
MVVYGVVGALSFIGCTNAAAERDTRGDEERTAVNGVEGIGLERGREGLVTTAVKFVCEVSGDEKEFTGCRGTVGDVGTAFEFP